MSEDAVKVLKAQADFTKDLYQVLSKGSGNLVFSPISLHTILSLAFQGAAGNTAQSFATALKIENANIAANGYKSIMQSLITMQKVTLHIANKIYAKDDFKLKKGFEDIAKSAFYSEIAQVNFNDRLNATKAINSWVEEKTKNKIKDLISPNGVDDSTRLVLVNAIYFKANWAEQFNERHTRKKPFYLNDKSKITVDMMHIDEIFPYRYDDDLEAQILELPYENRDVSLLIILPRKRNTLASVEAKLPSVDIASLVKNLKRFGYVNVSLPRFRIETTIQLRDALEKLGLDNVFTDKADFSGLSESSQALPISEVIQKAYIEVNEAGSEAAAGTGMRPLCMPPNFTADHPFLFFLIARDGAAVKVLFEGRVLAPEY